MNLAVNFCEETLTWGNVDNFYAENDVHSALIDTLKVRLFSPEQKGGASGEGRVLDEDVNPIWGKTRDLEKRLEYNIQVDKQVLKQTFVMCYKHLFPWCRTKDLWIINYPRIFGGMGIQFDKRFWSETNPEWFT